MLPCVWRLVSGICLLWFACMPGWANDDAPYVFERLGVRQGLSQNTVLDILQDSHGFIWLATENGLNRFDGYTVKTYYRDRFGSDGLASDYIWKIVEDARGDLWLASNEAGVVRWRRDHDEFQSFLVKTGTAQLERRRSTALVIARDGTIWVGTRGAGVYVLDADGNLIGEYVADRQAALGLSGNFVTAIAESEDGAVWVGTRNGLNRIDADRRSVEIFRHDPGDPSSLLSDQIYALHAGAEGRLWIGTSDAGASRWEPEGRGFVNYPSAEAGANGVLSGLIQDILEDRSGQIWFATQNGVSVLDPATQTFRQIRHNPADPYSLSNDYAMSIHQDANDLVWIGTRGGGVSRWNPRSWSLGARLPTWLSGAHVNAFADGPDGEIWLGTIGRGLLRLDAFGRLLGDLPLNAQVDALADARIMSLLRDRRGRIWIGTQLQGLYRYEPETGRLQGFPIGRDDPHALGSPGVMSLLESADGSIWAGTYNGGVSRIDAESGQIRRVAWGGPHTDLVTSRATALAGGPEGEIWIGTEDLGLARLNTGNGEITRFRAVAANAASLPSETIYSIHVDPRGDVWLGTAGHGVAVLGREALMSGSPVVRRFTTGNGLSSNVIYGIRADGGGQLWLSSNKGLMRLDPESRRVRVFHQEHGLFGDEFNFGAHFASRNGLLYFGGAGGYNIVDPPAVENRTAAPKLVLTQVEKFNKPAQLNVPVPRLRSLVLEHDDDVVTLEYAALDFAAPDKNLYSVLLEGFDRRWSAPSVRRSATYTDLDAGEYVFRVRGSNSEGVWSEQALELKITVLSAPWATWWAYGLYSIVVLLLLWLFLRINFKNQERKARLNQLAYYDPLTGLPNCDLFTLRAENALRQAKAKGESLAVMSVVVAIPKQITDTLGSKGKDDLLRSLVANFMRLTHDNCAEAVGQDLARIEGAEFAIFVRDDFAETYAVTLAERFNALVALPILIGEHRVPVSLSIGIATYPEHAEDIASMMKFASTAAYEQARHRKTGLLVYDKDMTARAAARLDLESRLRIAIETDQLELQYQPKYDFKGRITGAEALLRWHDQQRGWISPVEFVTLAEESDLIFDLDCWVIQRACHDLRHWLQKSGKQVRIAVNVSGVNLNDDRVVHTFAEHCRRYGIRPGVMEIELTESGLMRDMDKARQVVDDLKHKGFSIALDDFGTGYSSLTHLQNFSINTLKIDRQFVRDVDSDPDRAAICRAIVALAESLGIKTVAEGVETESQRWLLEKMGCDEFQGYLMSPAVPRDKFLELYLASTAQASEVVDPAVEALD